MSAVLCEIEDETTSLEYLVEAAQAGDREAFGELATRFEPMVYAIALRRLGNHSEAQELCQEVLVKAMQKIEQLKVPAAFGGWLRSITVRMAINRQVRRAPIDRDRAADARCDVRRVDARRSTRCWPTSGPSQVRGGLARLGELDRHTLEAFYVRGESLSQMSAVVRGADRHDQAPAARRAEAAGAAAGNGRGRVKNIALPAVPRGTLGWFVHPGVPLLLAGVGQALA